MAVNAIPRSVVKLGLSGVRLPLSIAEHLGDWSGLDVAGLPPVAVYDSVEAHAKQLLGRLIRDDLLVTEGRRQEQAARSRIRPPRPSFGTDEPDRTDQEPRPGSVMPPEPTRDLEAAEREAEEQRAAARLAEIHAEEERARQEAEERARKREQAARKAARTRARAAEAKKRQAELARAQAETETPDQG